MIKSLHKLPLIPVLLLTLFSLSASAATYVAVSTANGIDQYIVNGSTWTFDHQIDAHANLYGVTYNPSNGYLYTCDTSANQIIRVDPTNGTETILATRGVGTTGWAVTQPQNIAFGPDGKLYFSTAFGTPTSEGVFSMNLDGTGFSQFIANTGTGWSLGRARDLTWVGSNLYVTSRDNNNVYKFSNSGALVGSGAINSSAVTGATSVYADTNSNTLYVGSNQSGVNSIRTLNIGGTLPVAPGSATDSGGKVNSIGIIKVEGSMYYVTFNSGTSSHGAVYRLNADKTSTTVVADLGATGNDFIPMGAVGTGPLQAIVSSVPRASMINGTFEQTTVLAKFLLITNDVTLDPGTIYSSDNTNAVAVSTTGKLTAVGLGTANVVATYSGKSGTNTITVVPMVTTLIHRYGFTNDATDSVGSANGTVFGAHASFIGGQVQFSPTGQTDSNYVDFGSNVISGNDAITFEAWASFGTNYAWTRLFDFGTNNGSSGVSYITFTPHSSSGTSRLALKTSAGEVDLDSSGLDGQTNVHVVAVAHPLAGYMKLYINGVLASQNLSVSGQDLAYIINTSSFLGKSQFSADPSANMAVNEFRVYSGVLNATNVAIDYAAGPDNLVADPGALQSVALAINTNMLVQGQQVAAAYGNFANVSNVPLASFEGVAFASGDTNILTVNSNGFVKAVGVGSTTITVTYDNESAIYDVTVATLPKVQFLVADSGNNRVLIYDAVGTNWTFNKVFASGTYAGGPLTGPNGIAQDSAGNVYITDTTAGGRVLKFSHDGTFLACVGTNGVDFIGKPGYGATGPDGNVYFSTPFSANTIIKYDITTGLWSTFVTTTDGGGNYTLSNPIGIAFGPNGHLFVCNRGGFSDANRPVLEFDSSGAYADVFASGLTGPQGLFWDAAAGRFLATVSSATQIASIDTNGAVSFLTSAVASLTPSVAASGPNIFFTDYNGSGAYALTSSSNAVLMAGGMSHAQQIILAATNHAPVAAPIAALRNAGVNQWIISLSDLATNWSDVDGDAISFIGVLGSTNGASVAINGNYLVYDNTNNVNDQLDYIITDALGATNIGVVNMIINSGTVFGQTTPQITTTGGNPVLNFAGIPGYSYSVARSTSVNGPWSVVWTTNSPSNGAFQFIDADPPSPSAFYRLQWNP